MSSRAAHGSGAERLVGVPDGSTWAYAARPYATTAQSTERHVCSSDAVLFPGTQVPSPLHSGSCHVRGRPRRCPPGRPHGEPAGAPERPTPGHLRRRASGRSSSTGEASSSRPSSGRCSSAPRGRSGWLSAVRRRCRAPCTTAPDRGPVLLHQHAASCRSRPGGPRRRASRRPAARDSEAGPRRRTADPQHGRHVLSARALSITCLRGRLQGRSVETPVHLVVSGWTAVSGWMASGGAGRRGRGPARRAPRCPRPRGPAAPPAGAAGAGPRRGDGVHGREQVVLVVQDRPRRPRRVRVEQQRPVGGVRVQVREPDHDRPVQRQVVQPHRREVREETVGLGEDVVDPHPRRLEHRVGELHDTRDRHRGRLGLVGVSPQHQQAPAALEDRGQPGEAVG